MSSIHGADDWDQVQRKEKDKSKKWSEITIDRPQVVTKYNENMGGVDLFDQFIAKYSVLKKVNRWWVTLFFHVIDLASVNSYILFKEWSAQNPNNPDLKSNAKYGQLEFREELVEQLAELAQPPVPEEEAEVPQEDQPPQYFPKGTNPYSIVWTNFEKLADLGITKLRTNFIRTAQRTILSATFRKYG